MFWWTWRRSGPSTVYSRSSRPARRLISSSLSSFAFRCGSTRACSHRRRANGGTVPEMQRRGVCVGLLGGMSTPWIRGMECLLGAWSALALLVARVAADDVQLALAPHQLAVLADTLHTGTNFHRPPPGGFGPGAGGETIFLAGS